jgi:phospholipid/cholesterol/gamma-HCH transport system ATP-binding protein
MSEEKDAAQLAAEQAMFAAGHRDGGDEVSGVPLQMECSPGVPQRRAVARRRQRVLEMLHTLPVPAQHAIKDLMDREAAEHDRRDQAEQADQSEPAGPSGSAVSSDDTQQIPAQDPGQHRPSPTPSGSR